MDDFDSQERSTDYEQRETAQSWWGLYASVEVQMEFPAASWKSKVWQRVAVDTAVKAKIFVQPEDT